MTLTKAQQAALDEAAAKEAALGYQTVVMVKTLATADGIFKPGHHVEFPRETAEQLLSKECGAAITLEEATARKAAEEAARRARASKQQVRRAGMSLGGLR